MGLLLSQIETKTGAGLIVLIERGFPDIREWKICRFGRRAMQKVGDYPRSISNGRKSTLDSAWEARSRPYI